MLPPPLSIFCTVDQMLLPSGIPNTLLGTQGSDILSLLELYSITMALVITV